MRLIFIGDVHGCLEELKILLNEINYTEGSDRLIFLGDLLDRGPFCVETLRYVRNLNVEVVMGNHEAKHIKWRKNQKRELSEPGFKNKMWPFNEKTLKEHNQITDEEIEWLSKLPYFIKIEDKWNDNWLAVHGGILNDIPVDKQAPNLICRLGFLDKTTGKSIRYEPANWPPQNGIFWADQCTQEINIVYGHSVLDLKKVRTEYDSDYHISHWGRFGIDQGCVFGGHLTALIVDCRNQEDAEIFQVKAKEIYCPRNSD